MTSLSESTSPAIATDQPLAPAAAPPKPPAESSASAEPANVITEIMPVEAIRGLLPHRYPFALVDRIIEQVPGKSATGIKNVTVNEPHFQGHFPHKAIMPGVLIIEALAQVGGIIVTQLPDVPEGLFVFAGIDKVRFRRPVVPGDQLLLKAELLSIKRKRFGKIKGEAFVEGKLVASGELMFSLMDS